MSTHVCVDCSETFEHRFSKALRCKVCQHKHANSKPRRRDAIREIRATLTCEDCKQPLSPRTNAQKLCKACAYERSKAQHREWQHRKTVEKKLTARHECPMCGTTWPMDPERHGMHKKRCEDCNRQVAREKAARQAKENPEKVRASRRESARRSSALLTPEQRRANKLRENYKLTPDRYEELSQAQQHRCAVCGTHRDELNKPLFVDHDHGCCPQNKTTCGRCIRGLLCGNCNTALGMLRDDPGHLLSAAIYLEQYTQATRPERVF